MKNNVDKERQKVDDKKRDMEDIDKEIDKISLESKVLAKRNQKVLERLNEERENSLCMKQQKEDLVLQEIDLREGKYYILLIKKKHNWQKIT